MILDPLSTLPRTLTRALPHSKFVRLALCLAVIALLRKMRFARKQRGLFEDLSKVGRRVGDERAQDELAEYDVVIVGGGSCSHSAPSTFDLTSR